MNQILHVFSGLFWLTLTASAVSGALASVLIWRRAWWLKWLDAEESFWRRVGLPQLSFDRRLGESRLFTVGLIVLSFVFLLLAVAAAVLYFYFRHQLRRG